MTDFLQYIAMYQNESLKKVKYDELCEALVEDFIFESSAHEDKKPFSKEGKEPDSEVF
jgi:hypothetical protein